MKINYSQLQLIVDKQYAQAEMTPVQGGAQSVLNGDMWGTLNIASNKDNYKELGNMVKNTIFGDVEETEDNDIVYIYRHLTRLQERFSKIHKQL